MDWRTRIVADGDRGDIRRSTRVKLRPVFWEGDDGRFTSGEMHGWRGHRHGREKVFAFIPPHPTDVPSGVAGEGISVDPDGSVYAAEGPISRQAAGGGLTKYLKK